MTKINETKENVVIADFVESILEGFQLKVPDMKTYSPLTLAYLGDCVYEIIVRTMVVYQGNTAVQKLHKKSSDLVKAHTQSDMINALQDELTEDEMTIYKRGRNAYSATRAKNATMSDYRRATGFEALMGYLYIEKKYERIMQLINLAMERIEVKP